MAVRQDQVQVRIDYITDESKAFSSAIQDTKKYNQEIDASRKNIAAYEKELQKANVTEAKRAETLAKVALEEAKVAGNMNKIAEASAKAAKIDLSKLTPAQLVERARQLDQAMRNIPQSAPAFRALQSELTGVNQKLAEIRATSRGAAAEQNGFIKNALSFATGQGLFQLASNALRSLVNFGREALNSIDAGLKADAQVKAAISSTGGVAGRTFEQLKAQASELQKVTLFGDDQIQQAQALLLTFKDISGEVLDETVPALLDLSTAFDQDLKSSAIQVGKALNDPINGVTALQRVGVTFTDAQKALIKSLVDTGQTADAQRIILKELESQVGGSARAAAEAGQGPYQLLRNRLGEVQESVGQLIERGLRLLLPAFRAGTEFLEKFTDSLLSGEPATGKFSGAVNALTTVLTALVRTFQFVYQVGKIVIDNVFVPLYDVFQSIVPSLNAIGQALGFLLQQAQKLPVIGNVFKFISAEIQVFKDLLNDIPSTFAGIQAAAGQYLDNIVARFEGLVRSAKIVGKEIQAALSFGNKDALNAEITALKQQEIAAKAAGKTVGQAYAEARNAAISQSNAEAAATQQAEVAQQSAEARKQAAEQADEDAKAAADRRKKLLDAELKGVEAATLRREIVLDNARLKDQISEERYQEGLLAVQKRALEDQLVAYAKFGKDKTAEALKIQQQLIRLEISGQRGPGIADFAALPGAAPGGVSSTAGNTEQNRQVQDVGEEALLTALRQKFQKALITEQEYNVQKLELRQIAIAEEIAIEEAAGVQDLERVKKLNAEKLKVDEDLAKGRMENEIRTDDLRRQIQAVALQTTIDAFQLGIELLSEDEAARKKNATAIKAFQSAQVIIQGIAEVQKIWAGAAELGPIAGPIIGAIQTAIAVARTGLAVRKITNTKFEQGGLAKFGFFGGRPHSQGGTKGYFDDGTQLEVERDEAFAIVNKRNAPMLRALSNVNAFGGNGVPFFKQGGIDKYPTGGLPTLNTTPTSSIPQPVSSAQTIPGLEEFTQAVTLFQATVAAFPTEVKSRVVYQDIEKAGTELNTIRDDAAI